MIVVAGGTGTLGTRLVPRLAGQGLAVRVLTRDPARAQHLAGPGVEVARGDVRDPASIAGALRGVGTVISAVHGFAGPGGVSPASVDRAGNAHLIDAATRTGAAFVLVSVVGASPGHPIELFRAKHARRPDFQPGRRDLAAGHRPPRRRPAHPPPRPSHDGHGDGQADTGTRTS